MADIAGSYNSNQSYNPKFVYNISYSQTGRSGSSVSYRFNVSFTKQNGWYGYDININWNIGGSTGAKQIKSTADNSSGSTSFDVTCSTNAAGGTLAAQIWTSSASDSTHYQNKMDTGSRTVNKSTFNTAPSLGGNVTASGTTGNKTIPENTGTIAVSWPAATDANNNLSGYRLRVSVNGGGYSELTRTNASTRSYNHNVSNYGEGTTFKYAVDAYDSYSTWSGTIYSGTITKNKFTQSTIDSGSSIKYSDGNSTINFTIAGGSNTDGSAIKSRVLTCDGITVYNGGVGTGSINVTVFRTGTTPTGPYVKFDDIKNKFAGNSYTGTLTFKLTTSNNYNNSKSNSKNISVDLRTKPNAVASCTIATTASTAYKQVASTKNYYYIPDSGRYIRVEWGAGSGKLGESITYEVYVSYNGGSFQLVADKLSSATRAYNHNVPKQTASQSIRYRIRTKTSYGEYTDKDTALATLHFYNAPGISQGTITRGATTADVIVTVKSNSSIPNINTVGSWKVYVKDTTTVAGNSGNLTVSQGAQTIKVTGLTDAGQYDLKVTFNDDTGFASNDTKTIVIGANSPIFFVNKYGVGVNGVKASANEAMKIKGTIGMTDAGGVFTGVGGIRMYQGDANGAGMAIQAGGTVVVGSGESAVNLIETISNKADETLHLASDGAIKFVSNCQTIANRVTGTFDGSGNLTIPKSFVTTNRGANAVLVRFDTDRAWAFKQGGADGTASLDLQTVTDNKSFRMLSADGTSRVKFTINNTATCEFAIDGKIQINGSQQLAFSNGGGWYMSDTTWIRALNNKGIHTGGNLSISGNGEFGGYLKTSRVAVGNSSPTDLADGAPWYGIGKATVNLGSDRTECVQTSGYFGLRLRSSKSVVDIRADEYVLVMGHLCPHTPRKYWVGTNSPDRQWKGMCAEGGTVGASDARSKENIERLDGTIVNYNELTSEISEYQLPHFRTSTRAVGKDYYSFIKDKFKPSYYNYKLTDEPDEDTGEYNIPPEEEYKMLKNVGFIAQDYDLENDKVAQEFIFENEDGSLSYNHMSYVTVGMIALQEAIKKIEFLETENKNLKDDLNIIKESLELN